MRKIKEKKGGRKPQGTQDTALAMPYQDMDKTVFNKLRKIVYEKSSIALKENKEALVRARVAKRLRALDIPDYRTYMRYVTEDESGEVGEQRIEAMERRV